MTQGIEPILVHWKRFVFVAVAVALTATAASGQLHVDVSFQENEADGRLSVHGRDFDQLPALRIVEDQRVFGRSFELSGNTLVQNDPGFTASSNNVEIDPFNLDPPINNKNVEFRILAAPTSTMSALGGRNLSYWDGTGGSPSWGAVPGIETLEITSFGDTAIADGSGNHIDGFVIDATDATGSMHRHIDFKLVPDDGDDGVYLMLFEATLEPYAEWVPFFMLFEGFAGGDPTTVAAISDVETNFLFPLCSDGIDNDRDGNVDFPADAGCTDANDMSERGALAECDNGLDDDNDMLVDYPNDPTCASPNATVELPEPGVAMSLLAGIGLLTALRRRRGDSAPRV